MPKPSPKLMGQHPGRVRMRQLGIPSDAVLARLAGTHQSTVTNFFNGRRGLSKAVSIEVARVLRVPIEIVIVDWQRTKPKPRARPRSRHHGVAR